MTTRAWNWVDSALAALVVLAVAADGASTIDFLNRGGVEGNPLLGERPTRVAVISACILGAAALVATARLVLGRSVALRRAWLAVWTIVEGEVAWNNTTL